LHWGVCLFLAATEGLSFRPDVISMAEERPKFSYQLLRVYSEKKRGKKKD